MRSCYIHIPFCTNICSYCDFCKLYYHESFADRYLEALEKEIKKIYENDIISTIYIGGGTPSCLSIKQWKKLFQILEVFKTTSDLEFTIEVNLDSIDEEKLHLFYEKGVNRLSIGIESIDKRNQEIMERKISKEEIIRKIMLIREIGFSNINLDLMYAFFDENIKTLEKDLYFLLSLHPEHISTYSLMIEENTKLAMRNIIPISEELDAKMYQVICKIMKQNDYCHYEISNFCKKGYQSKHNLCYWNNEEYYGFGLGASYYINHIRGRNTRSFTSYIHERRVIDRQVLNMKDMMEYQIILNLRLSYGIDKEKFYHKFHNRINELYDYKELISNGFLIDDGKRLYIPSEKWYISNSILVKFLEGEQ